MAALVLRLFVLKAVNGFSLRPKIYPKLYNQLRITNAHALLTTYG